MGAQQQSIGANQSVMAAILAPVTGEPYKADKITRSVQKLGDGTIITHGSGALAIPGPADYRVTDPKKAGVE
ncbi:hypothetical protein SAMN05421770_101705 [Granulicella rosea]|uniref:Uncharacterized protein n=2 Tax=Granulicella rosea TaxID=474952 RepID=A0A239DXX4_9BACT|nr:hypothetical protein SAMN05421770_101705 [Granulicella rosea]